MIEGVKIIQLTKIPDERGTIFHMLRTSDPHFTKFGEIYFSKIYANAIKGWHLHKTITLNYCVVSGMIKLVLYDSRKLSKTYGEIMELFIGDDNYTLVSIPPNITNGHKGLSTHSILANCTDYPHDQIESEEMVRLDPHSNEIPYNWERKDR